MKHKYVARFVNGCFQGLAGPFDLDQSAEHYAEGFEAADGHGSLLAAFVLGDHDNSAERNRMRMKCKVLPSAYEKAMLRLAELERAAENYDIVHGAAEKEKQG